MSAEASLVVDLIEDAVQDLVTAREALRFIKKNLDGSRIVAIAEVYESQVEEMIRHLQREQKETEP